MRAAAGRHTGVEALGLLSAIAGAALIPLLFSCFAGSPTTTPCAWWAMAVAVCSPLFWFTALRPLSDMTGLAFAVAAQWLVLPPCSAVEAARPAHAARAARALAAWPPASACRR